MGKNQPNLASELSKHLGFPSMTCQGRPIDLSNQAYKLQENSSGLIGLAYCRMHS